MKRTHRPRGKGKKGKREKDEKKREGVNYLLKIGQEVNVRETCEGEFVNHKM